MILALLTAFLALFLNYCIGKPGGEFSPYEIFSFYTVWLSKRRLRIMGLSAQYEKQYKDNLLRIESRAQKVAFVNDFKKIIYNAAEPFFTWERAAGMCPVCFGLWVSLLISFSTLLFSENLLRILYLTDYFSLNLLIMISVSHVSIRILNKII